MKQESCTAVVRSDRIQLIIRKGEKGYKAFAKVLIAIEKKGCMSWYGDVTDAKRNEQCGLIITSKIKQTAIAGSPRQVIANKKKHGDRRPIYEYSDRWP